MAKPPSKRQADRSTRRAEGRTRKTTNELRRDRQKLDGNGQDATGAAALGFRALSAAFGFGH